MTPTARLARWCGRSPNARPDAAREAVRRACADTPAALPAGRDESCTAAVRAAAFHLGRGGPMLLSGRIPRALLAVASWSTVARGTRATLCAAPATLTPGARRRGQAVHPDAEIGVADEVFAPCRRTVDRVFADGQDVNAEMVRCGTAWVFRRYSDDPALLRLERIALAERRSLWGPPEARRVPPWEWRAAERPRR